MRLNVKAVVAGVVVKDTHPETKEPIRDNVVHAPGVFKEGVRRYVTAANQAGADDDLVLYKKYFVHVFNQKASGAKYITIKSNNAHMTGKIGNIVTDTMLSLKQRTKQGNGAFKVGIVAVKGVGKTTLIEGFKGNEIITEDDIDFYDENMSDEAFERMMGFMSQAHTVHSNSCKDHEELGKFLQIDLASINNVWRSYPSEYCEGDQCDQITEALAENALILIEHADLKHWDTRLTEDYDLLIFMNELKDGTGVEITLAVSEQSNLVSQMKQIASNLRKEFGISIQDEVFQCHL